MRETLIKIGAYIVMIFGVFLFLALVGFGIYLLITVPDARTLKKILVSTAVLIAAVLEILVTVSVFESMIEITKLEDKSENQ